MVAALDQALDAWWAAGALPSIELLRDGLRLLAAGEPLEESHRTLLLRAALAHGRGVQTALRHQLDMERAAIVLAESVVEWDVPPDLDQLDKFLDGNEPLTQMLLLEMERSRILLTGEARRRAQDALDYFAAQKDDGIPPDFTPVPIVTAPSARQPLRRLLLVLLLLAFVAFVLWQRRHDAPPGMLAMPEATYALLDDDGGAVGVKLDAFWIDQFEVTNREYRACVEAGACVWPVSPHSATRRDYFTNPAFASHPVVHVTYEMAETYCLWQGKRLPTHEEWQAAASVSPINGQAFLYPWGQTFDAQRANSLVSGYGDTVAVGSFRPGGDSSSGAADMAGNVAEWTSAASSGTEDDGFAIVKGGSFADGADGLTVTSRVRVRQDQAAAYIGMRCARSHLLTAP